MSKLMSMKEAIGRFVGDGARFGVTVGYAEQTPQRGTADALQRVADFIDEPTFVLAGDTALEATHLRRLADFHAERAADATLCLKRVPRAVLARTRKPCTLTRRSRGSTEPSCTTRSIGRSTIRS